MKGMNVKIKRKTHAFFGSFAITVILIGALCGFAAVDLSTDRYMPDRFGPFFEIAAITPGGVEFSFLAGDYVLDVSPVRGIIAELKKYRGLFPSPPRVFASLAAEGARRALAPDAAAP